MGLQWKSNTGSISLATTHRDIAEFNKLHVYQELFSSHYHDVESHRSIFNLEKKKKKDLLFSNE